MLLNENTTAATVSTTASAVGIGGSSTYTLKDLWSKATSTTTGTISASVPAHGVVMYRVARGGANANRHEAEAATISQGVVESNHLNFSGTGFVNGDNVAGSYVEFAVDAASAGTALLSIGYANGTTTNRPADISVNGTVVVAGSVFTSTGNWDTWAVTALAARFSAGTNTVRITATTAGGNPNLDYLDAVLSAPSPVVYQAEGCTVSQGVVEANHLGYTGIGFVNTDNVVGSFVECGVWAWVPGTTTVAIRFANATTANRPMDLTVNGALVATPAFAPTANWDTWSTTSVTVTLTAGANRIRLTSTTVNGGPNLDKLTVG